MKQNYEPYLQEITINNKLASSPRTNILNESRLRDEMNDRMDPLVANEGGIEAITLIIFCRIGNRKVHEDSE